MIDEASAVLPIWMLIVAAFGFIVGGNRRLFLLFQQT
jgi:hypothetical protein